jgi:dUTP pyrophosphatase
MGITIVETPTAPNAPSISIHHLRDDVLPPFRAYAHAAGYDIGAHLLTSGGRPYTLTIAPNDSKTIPTGIAARPPPGFFLACCSRSGLASKSIFVANAPGIIDPDYTGEINVILYNGGFEPYFVRHHDRIMQLLCFPLNSFPITRVASLSATERGDKGMGSTGQ